MNNQNKPESNKEFIHINSLNFIKRLKTKYKLAEGKLFSKKQEVKIERAKPSIDYKILKDKYGEKFAQLCRSKFSTILEEEGKLSEIILQEFAPNKFLYDDIIEMGDISNFVEYIYSIYKPEEQIRIKTNKSVEELLSEAGYDFYECHSDKEVKSFKNYFAKGEELCTFDHNRFQSCYVFWAIKKNVSQIKRKNFEKPKRQDEYGTSVISIQFERMTNRLSIKNRYNHIVENPDATFGNNLENIIPGLTDAFEREFKIKANSLEETDITRCLPNYVRASDGKIYKYNCAVQTGGKGRKIYYCPNNIIIDRDKIITLDKSRYLLIDYFIFDKVEKRMYTYDTVLYDSFTEGFKDIYKIEIEENGKKNRTKFYDQVDKETGIRTITIAPPNQEPIVIKADKFSSIIYYKNDNLKEVNNNFMHRCPNIKTIDLPNLVIAKDNFIAYSNSIEELNTPSLEKTGNSFLKRNNKLKTLYLPKLKIVGRLFLSENSTLQEINLPSIEEIDNDFLGSSLDFYNGSPINKTIKHINLPLLNRDIKEKATKVIEYNSKIELQELASKEEPTPKINTLKIYKYLKIKHKIMHNRKLRAQNREEGETDNETIINSRSR